MSFRTDSKLQPAAANELAAAFFHRVAERLLVRTIMVAVLGALYLIAGCGGADDPSGGLYGAASESDSADGCPEGGFGDLTVNIVTPGFEPKVRVSGPSGFADTLHASETLVEVPSGIYRVLAQAKIEPASGGELAGRVYSAFPESIFEVCVSDGNATYKDVQYTEHPGSGMLWVVQTQGEDADIVAFEQGDLRADGSVEPGIRIELASGNPSNNVVALTFDRWGNLWVAAASTYGDTLMALTPGQLAEGGLLDPARIIRSEDFAMVRDLALDRDANIWVSGGVDQTLLRFDAEQLADVLVGEEPEVDDYASVVIGSPDIESARGIEFDSAGNLWIADGRHHGLLQFEAAQLTSSGDRGVSRTLVGKEASGGYEYVGPEDLVFTNGGDLWVSYVGSSVLARYPEASLDSPEPGGRVAADLEPRAMGVAAGVAVDALAGVWHAHSGPGLQRAGVVGYNVTSSALTRPKKLVFYPDGTRY